MKNGGFDTAFWSGIAPFWQKALRAGLDRSTRCSVLGVTGLMSGVIPVRGSIFGSRVLFVGSVPRFSSFDHAGAYDTEDTIADVFPGCPL